MVKAVIPQTNFCYKKSNPLLTSGCFRYIVNFVVEINEPVNVWVLFKSNLVQPLYFLWHGRQIKADKVNLIHTSKSGSSLFYYFSVSASGNFYKLRFETPSLKWFLEETEFD